MIRYSENHHLNTDEEGTNVHIAIHLQGVTRDQAKGFVDAVLATADKSIPTDDSSIPPTTATVLRPQTSGPCVHIDQAASDDPDAVRVLGLACRHPDGECPHLETPEILCPVRDSCYAMREVARLRDACEAEQDEQDADMAAVAPSQTYETAAPEWVEPEPDDGVLHTYTVPATRKPTNPNAWSDEEIEVIRRAQSAAEAGRLYVDAFPESNRTVAAVSSRWYRLRVAGELIEPEPEEPDFTVPHPTYRPGDRVRITHALHRGQTGKIERYFPATENYLVAIDGMPDMIILQDSDLEAV